MCIFKAPSAPAVPQMPQQAQQQDAAVQAAQDAERRRQAAALGRQGTMLTGGAGLMSPAATTKKNLLGE